jgi:hypothetical protein
MANASQLIVPGEQRNPKTGDRQFDFEQLKLFLVNLANVATSNSGGGNSNTIAEAAYNQANNAYGQANTGTDIAEAAYDTANLALDQATATGAVYINGNLLLPNANIDFFNGNTTIMNGYTPDGIQSVVFVEVNPNLEIISLATTGNINVGQTIYMADGTDLYGAVNVANATAQTGVFNANLAYGQANVANTVAQTAVALGLVAYAAANAAANTVAVYEAGTLIIADANLNFNNSGSVNASVTANGTTQANVQFTINLSSLPSSGVQNVSSGNTSNLVISGNSTNVIIDTRITGGGGGGNTVDYQVDVYANAASPLANVALNFNNTATVNVSATANGTGAAANLAFTVNTSALPFVANVTSANVANVIIGGNSTNLTIDTLASGGGGGGNSATSVITDDVFVAANGQTVFNISSNVSATRYVFVYRNGVEQIPTTDYTSNGANVVVLTSGAFPGESIEIRNFTTVGNLTMSAGTSLIQQSNVALGAQPFYQQTYTYYTVPLVCAAGMSAKFVIQANTVGLYDLIVGGLANGNGTIWLSATDIASTTYNITSPWYYQSGDGSQNMYIGIKNRGGNPMSFNLAQLTLTRFN